MAGKVRHLWKRGDIYWARMAVPKHLQPIVGKVQLQERLGPGRTFAERLLPRTVFLLQRQIESAQRKFEETAPRAKRRSTPLSLHALAHAHYSDALAFDNEARDSDPRFALGFPDESRVADLRRAASGAATNEELQATVGSIIAKFLRSGAIDAEPGSPDWRGVARVLAGIELEALSRSVERDEGDFTGTPAHALLIEPLPAEPEQIPPVPLMALLDDYLKEKAHYGKGTEARRRWTPVFRSLVAFLGHDDAQRITKADVIRWTDKLRETKSPKTIKDTDLGSLRAVLGWAHRRDRIASNPVADVKLETFRPKVTREKGFTDAEALALLQASRSYQPAHSDNSRTRESAATTAAKRWVPLLCAHTGARVAEMTQLRREDVQDQGGIAFIKITPEAGSVKTGHFRVVPLHPQLVTLGFLDFVDGSPEGPLFYAQSKRGTGQHPSKQVAGRLSNWIRSLDLVSRDVTPNHAWRHRFKTLARELGLDPRVVDAIQGHAARTAGDSYGDVTLKAKQTALTKFASYEL